jgi:predicted permease
LSVVLLACAALLLSAFDRTSRVSPGFDPSSVLTAQLRLSATAYPTEAARADLVTRVLESVRAVPGVTSASTTLNRFIPGFFMVTRMHIEGRPSPDGQPYVVQFRRTSPGYFDTMRIPILRGRDIAAADGLDQPLVVVVSRQFADKYWPGEDPVGRRILRGTNPRPLTGVGVAGDVSDVSLTQAPAPTVYIPFSQNNVATQPVSLVVRTAGEPLAAARAVRAAVLSVDPQQPIDSVATAEQFLADSLGPERFRSTLLLILGGIGLALAGLGVYGVTSRSVTERTQELGVRLALGATPMALARRVVWESMRVVLVGLAAGVVLAAAAIAAMFRLLPNLEQSEAWVAAPAVLVLTVVAVASAIIPARRAIALTPIGALRGE